MTERIRVIIEDDELKALIPLLDELIIKKRELLDIQVPVPEQVDKFSGAREIIEAVEDDAESVIVTIETKLTEVQAYTEFIDSYNEAVVNRITNKIVNIEAAINFTNDFAEMTFQQIMFKLADAQNYSATIRRIIELDLVEINIEGAATEARIGKVQKLAKGLPQVDRATRMILLNIPGLREVLRLLYIIKLEERTLRLGGMRGPLTAAVTIIMYMGIILKNMQQRQERVEERQRALEKEMERRLITVEEALRTTVNVSEKYRGRIAL